jgi:hypothetical protein
VMAVIQAAIYQLAEDGSPNSVAMVVPTAAIAGTGMKERPYPRDRIC